MSRWGERKRVLRRLGPECITITFKGYSYISEEVSTLTKETVFKALTFPVAPIRGTLYRDALGFMRIILWAIAERLSCNKRTLCALGYNRQT